jgi:hypothetical protein
VAACFSPLSKSKYQTEENRMRPPGEFNWCPAECIVAWVRMHSHIGFTAPSISPPVRAPLDTRVASKSRKEGP